jgi:hypothetical protein
MLLQKLLVYNAVVFAAFVLLYSGLIGDPKHFDVPGSDQRNFASAVYFAATTHTTVGFGDIVAKSTLARSLTMVHLALVFIGMLVIPHWS